MPPLDWPDRVDRLILVATSPRAAGQMHALIPGSQLVLIDGGHLAPLLTQHQRLAAEIGVFPAARP